MPGRSRRDFLKLGSVFSGALAASRFIPRSAVETPDAARSLTNIIILVFDAMSGKNLSLYGYPRKTTPNFERFATRATVYNQHYSPGVFTVPGTASLLTGLYPWTHRAINSPGNLIASSQMHHNLFEQLGKQYYRLAFSQNTWPNYFFGQFEPHIERVLSPGSFSLVDQFAAAAFTGDLSDSHRAFDELLFQEGHPPASLLFGLVHNIHLYEAVAQAKKQGKAADLVSTGNYPIVFRLKEVFDGLLKTITELKQPFLAYLHIWSPHAPYRPAAEFMDLFNDGWSPEPKPEDPLSEHQTDKQLRTARRLYDRYIANVDFEFGRLFESLQAQGFMDNSYIAITSDHGELLERGKKGHVTPMLYDPVVRVPLIVSAPGQRARRDVNVPTSSVDILPTLVHLSGLEAPAWAEGQTLPGFGGAEDAERSLFLCEAKDNHPWAAWTEASYGLRKGRYKLTYYMGYPQLDKQDRFELYDIDNDPEELNNLYSAGSSVAQDLRRELLERAQAENAKYQRPA